MTRWPLPSSTRKSEQKQRSFLHDGIGFAAEEGAVQAVLIVLPEMERHPRAAHRPDTAVGIVDGRGVAPGVNVVMKCKAARAVHLLGGAAAALERHLDQVEQRPGGFRKVAHFGRPVVHLHVDVRGVLAVPRWGHAVRSRCLGGWPPSFLDGCCPSADTGRIGSTAPKGRDPPGLSLCAPGVRRWGDSRPRHRRPAAPAPLPRGGRVSRGPPGARS